MVIDFTPNIWAIIVLLLPTVFKLALDSKTILINKREVNHALGLFILCLFVLVAALVVKHIDPVNLFQSATFSFGLFALLFDYSLNLIRGKNIFYIDEGKDGKQSLSDSVYQKLGAAGVVLIKLWLFVSS